METFHRRQISELKEELYEKTSLYEDLIDRHAAELASKQKEHPHASLSDASS